MRMRILLIALVTVVAATAGVNYWLRYWPFEYHAAALELEEHPPTLATRFCSLVASARSHLPEISPDAVALDNLLRTGRIDKVEFVGGLVPTNVACDRVADLYSRVLFHKTNRLQQSSGGFASNTPLRVCLYSGTNFLGHPLLYDRRLEKLAFRSYYFSLRAPTNLYVFFVP